MVGHEFYMNYGELTATGWAICSKEQLMINMSMARAIALNSFAMTLPKWDCLRKNNWDGIVDELDLELMNACMGATNDPNFVRLDMDYDSRVDMPDWGLFADLTKMRYRYAKTKSGGVKIPALFLRTYLNTHLLQGKSG